MASYHFLMNWLLFCSLWLMVVLLLLVKIGDWRDDG